MRLTKDTVSRIASDRGPEPVAAVSATFATAEAASTHKAAGAGSGRLRGVLSAPSGGLEATRAWRGARGAVTVGAAGPSRRRAQMLAHAQLSAAAGGGGAQAAEAAGQGAAASSEVGAGKGGGRKGGRGGAAGKKGGQEEGKEWV